MPWFLRHWINAVRLVFPLVEEIEVAAPVLAEPLPQAASVRLAAPAASTATRRRAGRPVL
jgi:hypothetical protein